MGSTDIINNVKNVLPTTMNYFNYFFTAIVISVITIVLYFVSTDPKSATTTNYIYISTIIIPLIALFWFMIYKNQTQLDMKSNIANIVPILIAFGCIVYFYITLSSESVSIISYILDILFIIIFLIGLAIFFVVFGNYLKSLSGWTGFFAYIFFYIPCLIIDFVNYIINEVRMTGKLMYILLLSEIVLILLYMYIPRIINYMVNRGTFVLLSDPYFLKNKQLIANSDILKTFDTINPKNETKIFRKNYSISMWLYMNYQSSNYNPYNKETTIIDYAGGTPKITYFNDTQNENGPKDKFLIYFTNNPGVKTKSIPNKIIPVQIDLPKQKWNHLVFNYSANGVDLFVNGNLEKKYEFKNGNNPIYNQTDIITTGQDNGLNGAICNVRYHKDVLTKLEIVNSYNILMNKNPPVNIL